MPLHRGTPANIRPTSPPNLVHQAGPANGSVPAQGAASDTVASKADALFYALMMLIWTSVWRIQDIFPILGKVKLPLLVLFAVIVLFFMDRSPQRSLAWAKSPILGMIGVLVAIMLLGLPTSLWPGKGISFIARDFFPTIVLCVVITASIRDEADLDRFAMAMLSGAMIYAGNAFLFHRTMINGRISGLEYYDANDFGMLMGASLPFAVYFLRKGVAWWKQALALVALGLFLIMIVRSGSRGAFLTLITVALYFTLLYSAIPAKIRFSSVVFGVFMLMAVAGDQYWALIKTIMEPEDDYNMTSDTGRKEVWKRGMGYMWANPFLGTGVRTFPQAEGELSEISKAYAEYGRGIKWSVAHNSFVEIGAECGVIALVIFSALFLYSIFSLARLRMGPAPGEPPPARAPPRNALIGKRKDKAYAQMLIASFLGYMVGGFFVSAEYVAFLYVLFALTIAVPSVIRRRSEATPPSSPPSSRRGGVASHPPPRAPRRVAVQWVPSA